MGSGLIDLITIALLLLGSLFALTAQLGESMDIPQMLRGIFFLILATLNEVRGKKK